MTLNGEMALILHYFTQFVYDVVGDAEFAGVENAGVEIVAP